MKASHSLPPWTDAYHHRLAGLPLIYSPQTKTPLYLRLHAGCWRILFAAWTRLWRKRPSRAGARLAPIVH